MPTIYEPVLFKLHLGYTLQCLITNSFNVAIAFMFSKVPRALILSSTPISSTISLLPTMEIVSLKVMTFFVYEISPRSDSHFTLRYVILLLLLYITLPITRVLSILYIRLSPHESSYPKKDYQPTSQIEANHEIKHELHPKPVRLLTAVIRKFILIFLVRTTVVHLYLATDISTIIHGDSPD